MPFTIIINKHVLILVRRKSNIVSGVPNLCSYLILHLTRSLITRLNYHNVIRFWMIYGVAFSVNWYMYPLFQLRFHLVSIFKRASFICFTNVCRFALSVFLQISYLKETVSWLCCLVFADLLHVLSYLPKDLNFVNHSSYIGWKEYDILLH